MVVCWMPAMLISWTVKSESAGQSLWYEPWELNELVWIILQCHCYVCDALAPCSQWGDGSLPTDHCHASDKEARWKSLRKISKCSVVSQPVTPTTATNLLGGDRIFRQTVATVAQVASTLSSENTHSQVCCLLVVWKVVWLLTLHCLRGPYTLFEFFTDLFEPVLPTKTLNLNLAFYILHYFNQFNTYLWVKFGLHLYEYASVGFFSLCSIFGHVS